MSHLIWSQTNKGIELREIKIEFLESEKLKVRGIIKKIIQWEDEIGSKYFFYEIMANTEAKKS